MKIKKEYGYVLFIGLLLYLMQQLVFIIPVLRERSKTKIEAPTLYPRDSEIQKLNLSESQVLSYYRAENTSKQCRSNVSIYANIFDCGII